MNIMNSSHYNSVNFRSNRMKQLFKGVLSFISFEYNELGQLIKNIIEPNLILVLGQMFIVGQKVFQLIFAVKQLVNIPGEDFEFGEIALFFVFAQ